MRRRKIHQPSILLLLLVVVVVRSLNAQNDTLEIMGDAKVSDGSLQITTNKYRSIGRVMYKSPIPICANSTSFSSSFVFSITNSSSTRGDGLAFIISGDLSQPPAGSFGYWLGLFNEFTNRQPNHVVAVEFDTVRNWEPDVIKDHDDNHVGIDVNEINSGSIQTFLNDAGHRVNLHDASSNVSVWIEYLENKTIAVFVNRNDVHKPATPLMRPGSVIDLCQNAAVDGIGNVYVGFSAATGNSSMDVHLVHSWNFNSSSNVSFNFDSFPPTRSPSQPPSQPEQNRKKKSYTVLVVAILVPALVLILLCCCSVCIWKKFSKLPASESLRLRENLEHNYLPSLPSEISYSELKAATSSFSSSNVLGKGGFGVVYVGILPSDQSPVAVKRISEQSHQGEREFLAEVQIITRLSHRNLVPLRGWCCRNRELLLVYDFMPNGSLDKALYTDDEKPVLNWEKRYRIITGLASALQYLHEECEQKVVHRDVKPSNVLLDAEFNARLGDFGLARLVNRDRDSRTTNMAGTFGYLAPEINVTGKSTLASDVYSFGIVALEVASGRRPFQGDCVLVEWIWGLYVQERVIEAADVKLEGRFGDGEMEIMLNVGLACSDPNPRSRPTMQQVVSALNGDSAVPVIDRSRREMTSSPFSISDGESLPSFSIRSF